MAAALAGLGADSRSRAIAAALRTTALGRLPREERDWAARIEARRAEVADLHGRRTPDQVGVFDIRLAVQWMSVPPVLGRLLMRLVRELAPASCLELGTGFGISGAYQAAALGLNRAGRLVSVDVDPRPAAIAAEGFAVLGLDRAAVRTGAGDQVLADALAEAEPVDFAFVDADHREGATVEALATIGPRLSPGAVIVFDDVATSWAGMARAWSRIEADPRISRTRHLGRFGIAMMRDA